jgi:hypothetical protein
VAHRDSRAPAARHHHRGVERLFVPLTGFEQDFMLRFSDALGARRLDYLQGLSHRSPAKHPLVNCSANLSFSARKYGAFARFTDAISLAEPLAIQVLEVQPPDLQ